MYGDPLGKITLDDVRNVFDIGRDIYRTTQGGSGGGGGAGPVVSLDVQHRAFLAAWQNAPQEARAGLLRAAAAANNGRWGTVAEVERDTRGFVVAANGGSDGKIGSAAGKQFNAVYMTFIDRYVSGYAGGPVDSGGPTTYPENDTGGGIDWTKIGREILDAVRPRPEGPTAYPDTTGPSGPPTPRPVGFIPSPLTLALVAAGVYLLARRRR